MVAGPAAKDRAHDYVKSQVLTEHLRAGIDQRGRGRGCAGMSRTPVREAFLRLEAEGLLRLYPQRGALVVPVSSEEARAVIEARRVLEQFAAQSDRTRPAACAAVFERLSGELQRQRDAAAASNGEDFVEADRAYHDVTLAESGNVIVAGFYSSLRDRQMRMNRELVMHEERITTILEEHRLFAEAVRDGDLGRTEEVLGTHLAEHDAHASSSRGASGLAAASGEGFPRCHT